MRKIGWFFIVVLFVCVIIYFQVPMFAEFVNALGTAIYNGVKVIPASLGGSAIWNQYGLFIVAPITFLLGVLVARQGYRAKRRIYSWTNREQARDLGLSGGTTYQTVPPPIATPQPIPVAPTPVAPASTPPPPAPEKPAEST